MRKWKHRQTIPVRDLIDALKHAEDAVFALGYWLGEQRDKYQEPMMLDEVRRLLKRKQGAVVSTAWLQRRYKIGYARAARLLDALRAGKIVPAKNIK